MHRHGWCTVWTPGKLLVGFGGRLQLGFGRTAVHQCPPLDLRALVVCTACNGP
jgi:hypothetical protein